MPDRISTASLAGFILGVALAVTFACGPLADAVDSMAVLILIRVVTLTIALLMVAALLRRWLTRARAEWVAVIQRASRFKEEVEQRLDRQEETLTRSFKAQLEEAHAENARLQEEYDEVCNDYNRVVADSLQQSADLFAPHSGANRSNDSIASCTPLPRSRQVSGGTCSGPAQDTADST